MAELSEDIATFLLSVLAGHDSIKMTRGTGSRKVEGVVTGMSGSKIAGITVRAFPYDVYGSIDWTTLKARDGTNINGQYTLYLDPGTYELSFERKYIQIMTETKVVT
jgi:hypothetical protein